MSSATQGVIKSKSVRQGADTHISGHNAMQLLTGGVSCLLQHKHSWRANLQGGDFVSSWEAHLQQAGVSASVVGNCGHAADVSSTAALTSAAATHGIQAALSKSSQVIWSPP